MIQAIMAGAALGMQAYSAFGPKSGPDYSGVTNQYNARNSQISQFAQNLAASRAKYMTSLNNMYNDAYSRFSGNAEAGFANRGMSVSGGAFASTLAKEAGRMSFEGANTAAGMERQDLSAVDNAYGSNSNGYMSAISGGPAAQYAGDRADMGGFAQMLGRFAQPTLDRWSGAGPKDNYGNSAGSRYETDYSSPVSHRDNLGLGV